MTDSEGPAQRFARETVTAGLLPPVRSADAIDRTWLDRSGHRLLVYWMRGLANPFINLLYNQGLRHGYACVYCPALKDLPAVPRVEGTVFHFHWLKTLDDDRKAEEFARVLMALKSRGGVIVWTAHNVLPHDAIEAEHAIKVRRLMVEAADAIHLMNRQTPDLVEPYYSIRHKITFYSPHPSYLGAYPNTVTREDARFQLGLGQSALVFLCFGALLRYKGLGVLIAAAERFVRENPRLEWQILVAGYPLDGTTKEQLLASPVLRDRMVLSARLIQVNEVEYYLNAADFCVLPYQQSLNSGVAQLSLSFGVPIIAPDVSAFDEIPSAARLSYPREDVARLAEALARAAATDGNAMRKSALKFARSRRPEKASAMFFDALSAAVASRS